MINDMLQLAIVYMTVIKLYDTMAHYVKDNIYQYRMPPFPVNVNKTLDPNYYATTWLWYGYKGAPKVELSAQ